MSIQLLDAVVADAIAAGEVIERPASVVKELVENALDAGARRIDVEIDGGGAERILVVDDGVGIAPAELALAFMRHATSKVREIRDLAAIDSLGFRGEALASIGAVSRVDCQSSTPGAGAGAAITVEYGKVGQGRSSPPVQGTRMEVRGLFENTPGRRAFLRREATEVSLVTRVLTGIALVCPGVSFSLRVGGRRVLSLPGGGDLVLAFQSAHPGASGLLSIGGSRGTVAVDGVLQPPSGMRRTRDHLYLAVNGRLVASRSLGFAVEQAYRTLAPPGLYPAGVVRIHVPHDAVDVNVHPAKREVRFRDERGLFGVVQEACVAALSGAGAYGGRGLLGGGEARVGVLRERPVGDDVSPQRSWLAGPGRPVPALAEPAALSAATADSPRTPLLRRGPFRLLGQVRDSFIVAEGPTGIVLVDQHAAHERVQYNRLVAAASDGTPTLQPMLVPALLHLTPAQRTALGAHHGDLRRAGIELEEFGADAVRLLSHHASLRADLVVRLALEVLDELASEAPERDAVRRLERTTATVACHSSVRFGQRLSNPEMEQLLRDLEVAEPGITCPHGRPTLLEITEADLRREFKRA